MSQSWNHVIKDMLERNEAGAKKYNKYLTPDTGEDMLQHAYEEALDLAVYLKTAILKRERDETNLNLFESERRSRYCEAESLYKEPPIGGIRTYDNNKKDYYHYEA